jgi:HAD superfamily hydrolase (TIGR01509 family)
MKEYELYIFDLDNTLVDSRKGYEEAFKAGFGEFNIPYDPALYNEYVRTPLDYIFSKYYPNSPCKYRDFVSIVLTTYERSYLNDVSLFPDAERCLDRLSKKGKVLGVVSNSYTSQICAILSRLGVEGMFASFVGYERVEMPKPDPEPVLLCRSEMGAVPERSVMIGDSVNDILAGKGAGLFSVLIDRYCEDIPCDERDLSVGSLDEI